MEDKNQNKTIYEGLMYAIICFGITVLYCSYPTGAFLLSWYRVLFA